MPTIIKPKIISNIVQQQIVPNKPKILANEQIYVYVPRASTESPGIASFNDKDFLSFDGHISLSWPMKTQIEEISNPLNEISRVKLLSDEFEQTGNESEITNPLTEIKYISDTAEVKLKRTNRNAFLRPELIMLDNSSDFEKSTTPEGYSKYTLKRNNPLVQPALVKLDNEDFNRKENETIDIRWPYAHNTSGTNRTDGYGLIKINPTSKLFFTGSNLLDVDLSSKLNKDFTTLDEKTTVSLTDIIPIQTDNKTYRTNLAALKEGIVQDLVKLKFEIVDELPNTGETNIIYLLPEYTTKIEVLTYEDLPTIGEEEIRYLVLDTNKYYIWNNKYVEYTNIYKEYIWLDELNKYEQLGTSDIELYANKVAYDKGISNLLALNVQDAIDELADIKVDKVEGSTLITNDDLTKLAGIEASAQENIIESIKVDNTALTINEDKEINIDLSGKVDKEFSTDYAYTEGLVFSWDTDHYRVGDGTSFTGTETNIIIPKYYDDGTHGVALVTELYDGAFKNNTSIISVSLPDSIIRSYSDVFKGCTNLKSITFPEKWVDMGLMIFYGCSSLSTVKLNENMTTFGGQSFQNCSALEEIIIPKNITSMNNSTFIYCSNLTKIYMMSQTPPTTDVWVFHGSGITATTGAIYVPYESLEAYKTATGWSTFADVIYPIPDGKDLTNKLGLKVDKVAGKALSTNDLTNTLKSNYDAAYSHSQIVDSSNPHATTFANLESKPTTISGYGITDAYTKTEVDSKLTAVYKYKGSVANFASLPTSGLTIGDVYNVEDTGDNYAWTGTVWDKLAGTIDLSGYVPTSRTVNGHALSSDVTVSKSDVGLGNVDNTSDANKPVSTAQATAIGLKVDKVLGKELSTNDYDNTEKQNVADNTSARHTHLNKAILDSITASYTIEEQTKLGAISGTNTGDQILPVNSDFTLSGLSEKNFSSLTEKPTTLEGYGITDGLNSSLKGSVNGLAELDENGKVLSTQLPSYVDDVLEFANLAGFPSTGETGKIYVALDTNLTYRWGGTAYVEISPSLALGETSSTAYRGDKGKTAYDHSQLTSGNPHNVTKSNVGLSNVYNPTAYGGISYGGGAGESGVSFTDLNSLVYTGFYTCYGTTANVPSASYSWFIQHINSNVGNVSATQTAIAYGTTNIIYKRNKSSSTWSAWENISPSLKENLTNKVTSISSSSTDTQYPSAKCVYDIIGNIETLLAEV